MRDEARLCVSSHLCATAASGIQCSMLCNLVDSCCRTCSATAMRQDDSSAPPSANPFGQSVRQGRLIFCLAPPYLVRCWISWRHVCSRAVHEPAKQTCNPSQSMFRRQNSTVVTLASPRRQSRLFSVVCMQSWQVYERRGACSSWLLRQPLSIQHQWCSLSYPSCTMVARGISLVGGKTSHSARP